MPTKLDPISFDRILHTQNPFGPHGASFDLRGISLITPAALVQLAAFCHALSRAGSNALIVADDEAVRSYLMRSGFCTVVSGVARIEPEIGELTAWRYQALRGSNPMLLEVTKIERGATLPALLDQIVWVLCHRLKYRKNDAFDVTMGISEVCQNTFDHNSGTVGFIAMQVYGRDDKRFLEIGVSDCGDGLAATLRRNPRNTTIVSDLAAIQAAMQLGTSEIDDPTRGTGLYHLLGITYKHAGSVQIRSGRAKVRYRMDRRQGWAFSVPPAPGVHVALTLPSKIKGLISAPTEDTL